VHFGRWGKKRAKLTEKKEKESLRSNPSRAVNKMEAAKKKAQPNLANPVGNIPKAGKEKKKKKKKGPNFSSKLTNRSSNGPRQRGGEKEKKKRKKPFPSALLYFLGKMLVTGGKKKKEGGLYLCEKTKGEKRRASSSLNFRFILRGGGGTRISQKGKKKKGEARAFLLFPL